MTFCRLAKTEQNHSIVQLFADDRKMQPYCNLKGYTTPNILWFFFVCEKEYTIKTLNNLNPFKLKFNPNSYPMAWIKIDGQFEFCTKDLKSNS